MNGIWPLLLAALLQQSFGGGTTAVEHLFEGGKTWPQFLASVSAQRELWLKTESIATVPPDLDRACEESGTRTAVADRSRKIGA